MPQTFLIAVTEETLQIVHGYASREGISSAALLSAVAQSHAEWYIPVKSFDPVSVPKKMLSSLFETIPNGSIDKLAEQWVIESKNIVLLSGNAAPSLQISMKAVSRNIAVE